ncbi:MAG: hypothetical protein R6U86_00330 [Bacteroidales bacterium]
MGVFQQIRQNLRTYFLRAEMKKRRRNKMVMGLDESRTIGIIFDASEAAGYSHVVSLVAGLRDEGKKVRCMGFVRQKQKPDFLVDQIHFSFFQARDFSWSLKLKAPALKAFVENPTDLLLDLSPSGLFFPKYLAAIADARYKVGNFHPDQVEIYDLMIREPDPFSLKDFMDHCIQYLKIIKKPMSHA